MCTGCKDRSLWNDAKHGGWCVNEKVQVLFRLVSTELLEGDFYTCADTKHKKV